MSTTRIKQGQWGSYFDGLSANLVGKRALVEDAPPVEF